jgi:hypothetical protein
VCSSDLIQPLLKIDAYHTAQITRDQRDQSRLRILGILRRFLGMEDEHLRCGINAESIPWKKIEREESLAPHYQTAIALREWSNVAARGRLGIGHVFELFHAWGYLHTLDVKCCWDRQPYHLDVAALQTMPISGKIERYTIDSKIFKQTAYYEICNQSGEVIGYVDALLPQNPEKNSRIRDRSAKLLGLIKLTRPGADSGQISHFEAILRDGTDQATIAILKESGVSANRFFAKLFDDDDNPIGFIDDRLEKGKIAIHCEFDRPIDRRILLGALTVFAELARLRKDGWPQKSVEPEKTPLTDIEKELGPRRRHKI